MPLLKIETTVVLTDDKRKALLAALSKIVAETIGKPEDYVMAAEDIAKVAVLMAALPPEVNLYEATILPNHQRSFIGRG